MKITTVTVELTENEASEFHIIVSDGVTSETAGPMEVGVSETVVLQHDDVTAGKAPPGKAIRRHSKKQEDKSAVLIGGRRQPGSGSSPRAKGDVRAKGKYRGECKFTYAESYSLTKAVMLKIASECSGEEKPIVFIDFKTRGSGQTTDSLVVLFASDFQELLNAAGNRE